MVILLKLMQVCPCLGVDCVVFLLSLVVVLFLYCFCCLALVVLLILIVLVNSLLIVFLVYS